MVAAAAQEAAEVGSHTQWDRRHLTRKSNQTLSKKQQQQKSKQLATKNYEIYTKGMNKLYKGKGTRINLK